MGLKAYNETDIQAIANAIRSKNGGSTTYKAEDMAAAVLAIPTGGSDARVGILLGLTTGTLDLSDQTGMQRVEQYQFYGKANITGVVLPASVDYINNSAFVRSGVKSFDFSHIATIMSTAFQNSDIESVVIDNPTGTTLYGYVFNRCTSLQSVDLTYATIGTTASNIFQDCTALETVILPQHSSILGSSTFEGCSSLGVIIIPNNITNIGASCFANCTTLKMTELPATVTTIGSNAFQNTGIDSIDIKCSLAAPGVFQGCTQLETVKIRGQKVGISNTSNKNFTGCTALKKVWISESCQTIYCSNATYAPFNGCTALTDIYCEAASKPSGWGYYWPYTSGSTQATVHWGTTEADFDAIVAAQ